MARAKRGRKLLGAVFILAGFALAILYLQNNLSQDRMARDGRDTEGQVVDIVSGRLPDGTNGHAAMVTFRAEGASFRVFEPVSAAFAERHDVGDTITLRYYVRDPRLTVLEYQRTTGWMDYAPYLAGFLVLFGAVLNVMPARR